MFTVSAHTKHTHALPTALLAGFSEYDKDHDSSLTFEELQAVIPNSAAVFRLLDANSDRYLTVEEIEEMKQSLLAARAKESGAQTGGGGEEGDETVPTGQPPVTEPLMEKEREAVSVLNSKPGTFSFVCDVNILWVR